jgi:hypothetical protein
MGFLKADNATSVEVAKDYAALGSRLGGVGAEKPPGVPTNEMGAGQAGGVVEPSAKLADGDAPEKGVPVGTGRRRRMMQDRPEGRPSPERRDDEVSPHCAAQRAHGHGPCRGPPGRDELRHGRPAGEVPERRQVIAVHY